MQLRDIATHAQNDEDGGGGGRRGKEHSEPDYSAGKGRRRSRRYSSSRSVAYSLKIEPQITQKRPSFISRTHDGKFVLSGVSLEGRNDAEDEGGFGVNLPPNRFRTRSVAIVAGYSPERLYSNVPPGAFVVESGVYKVGADREWERPEPIYWKQVVYEGDTPGTTKRKIPQQPSTTSIDFRINSHLNSDLELPKDQNYNQLRASSPLDQASQPHLEYLSPMDFSSELSSVRQPSSAEKSLPSTHPSSSISYPTTTTLDSESTPRSRFATSSSKSQTELETIQEDLSSSEYLVKADIHHSKEEQEEEEDVLISSCQIPQPQPPKGPITPLALSSSPPSTDPEYENMAVVRHQLNSSTNNTNDDEEVKAITSSSSTSSPSSPQKNHFYENWPPLPPPVYHATPIDAFSSDSCPSRPESGPPFLDLSIDRHYEFEFNDGKGLQDDDLTLLPRRARPYHGYNPRRDRPEFAASLAESERGVFSDSEIYSPVFARGRPLSETPFPRRISSKSSPPTKSSSSEQLHKTSSPESMNRLESLI